MSREETRTSNATYYSVIGGSFRTQVPQDHPEAVKRDWESSDGKKGTKYERIVNALIGTITNIQFVEGDFGVQLVITLDEAEDKRVPRIALSTASREAEYLMKCLPTVDLTKPIRFRPYSFEDEKTKKEVRGMEMSQENAEGKFLNKAQNFFKDPETKENLNGFPAPDDEDTTGYDADDWKIYFMKCRKFLIKYTNENIIAKLAPVVAASAPDTREAPEIFPEDIPF